MAGSPPKPFRYWLSNRFRFTRLIKFWHGEDHMAKGRYQPAMLVRMFRKAAKLRQEMLDAAFTDNGGAIHSAERILDISE
jgi:hypothetical protein